LRRFGRVRLTGGSFALLALGAFAIPLGLTLAGLAGLLFAARFHFALCLTQQAQIVFCVLLKVLSGHTVIGQLGVARQLIVFVDNLLGRTAHLAFGTRAVKNPVYDIAPRRTVAVILDPRAGFGRSHLLYVSLVIRCRSSRILHCSKA
jgi:hypothetical protein